MASESSEEPDALSIAIVLSAEVGEGWATVEGIAIPFTHKPINIDPEITNAVCNIILGRSIELHWDRLVQYSHWSGLAITFLPFSPLNAYRRWRLSEGDRGTTTAALPSPPSACFGLTSGAF